MSGPIRLKSLLLQLCISVGTGALSGFLIFNQTPIYKSLEKPFYAPPAFLFPIVWTVLYVLMGIAAYIISDMPKDTSKTMWFYYGQLALSFFWPLIFFNLRSYGFAFFEIILLLITVIVVTVMFFRLQRTAGLLMIPYVVWVAFATLLNYNIWQLNK